MNAGIFNRVNTGGSKDCTWTMYSEWTSLQTILQNEERSLSVLNKFPGLAGKDVAASVVKHLAQNLGISNIHCERSNLETDRDVQWCMEVICFGLSLPLTENDTIKDCVNVYCEWLMALYAPKACVPKPVCDEPNMYARKIIQHLFNLFKPRLDASPDLVHKQVLHCHRVLRKLQSIALESNMLTRETWEALLIFLLSINDTLLAPPTVKDDIGDQMSERILSVLFEIWLLACARCFPTPPLWKTFREMCCYWRHRSSLVEQWNRVTLSLTSQLLKFMYGPDFPELKIPDEDTNLLPANMSNECVAQSWFRFLHTLQNPVDLCRPGVISQTPKFLHYAITSETVVDPCQHPCLGMLPHIFLKSMKGIAALVDAFLGIYQCPREEGKGDAPTVKFVVSHSTTTPPQQRSTRISKSLSVTTTTSSTKSHQKPSLINITGSKSHAQSSQNIASATPLPVINPSFDSRLPLSPYRPKCNSILHLFSAWLFEASLTGSDQPPHAKQLQYSEPDKATRLSNPKLSETRRSSGSQATESLDVPIEQGLRNYEAGRAEAIGALCRIFCAKKTDEEILPVYLARFYLAVQHGLRYEENATGQVLASVLFNSSDLLRLDLDGVMVLVPHMLTALETVLPDRDIKFKMEYNRIGKGEKKEVDSPSFAGLPSSIPLVELRRASINLLLTMLPLPLHFHRLPIKDISGCGERGQVTFQSLRPRLVNVLFNTLQCEGDSTNTQMLLGGLLLIVQDAAAFEEVGHYTLQHDAAADSTTNLLGSANISDTLSSNSASDFSGISSEEQEIQEHDTYTSYDSAHALFVRATYLVCHRLISSWKTDLNVSLAALELLSGFAKLKIQDQDAMECKRTVKWICDFIVYQCSRPPPAHSKDLHSTIVAAFQCVTIWLVEHPYLLQDKECLSTVLEVVELGISGSKSQPKHTDTPCMKGDKECKPASMRVRDAAEAALASILDQVGAFPSLCGPESLSSLLDEDTLLQYCNSWNGGNLTKEEAIQHFRFFVVENAYILSLLEQPLGNDQDPQPTVTVLIRGPSGRHAWAMQLRHLPRHKSGSKCLAVNPGRPLPMNDLDEFPDVKQHFFPEAVDRIPTCKAEKSIPSLDSLMNESKIAADHDKLSRLLDIQVGFEENIEQEVNSQKSEYPNPETECKAPEICQDFQTARLFLSHFGFLSLEALKESITCPVAPLVALDSAQLNFATDVDGLDNISSRTHDTVLLFYVKAGQKNAADILANVNSSDNINSYFLEFLGSLGWPVDVAKHPGWTGQLATSWKISSSNPKFETPKLSNVDHGGSLYDGQQQVLYWSDFSSEVAFVVPSATPKSLANSPVSECDNFPDNLLLTTGGSFDRLAPERHSAPGSANHCELSKPRTLSLDLEHGNSFKEQDRPVDVRSKKMGRQFSSAAGTDIKVLVVWLESFEDHIHFPAQDILFEANIGEGVASTPRIGEKDSLIIFIHALQNGLYRIHMQGHSSRISLAIPLVDGMVVSRRVLGTLIRQTSLNICKRKRLENDGYQPPHVRRKLKIQEMVHKYQCKTSEPEFYTALFNSAPTT